MQTDYLADKRTRDTFYQKKFSKSHSNNTIQNCKTALKNLDNFCLAKYGKASADQIIDDLKKMPMTSTYNRSEERRVGKECRL